MNIAMPALEALSFEICRRYPEKFPRHILKMLSRIICFGVFLNLKPPTTVHISKQPQRNGQRLLTVSLIKPSKCPCVLICPGNQIYTFPPDKIINSVFFHSQRHPGLDDKLHGHPTYLLFTNSVTARVGTPGDCYLCLNLAFISFFSQRPMLSSSLSHLQGLPQLTTSQEELFLSLPSSHHTLLVSLYSPISFCHIGNLSDPYSPSVYGNTQFNVLQKACM